MALSNRDFALLQTSIDAIMEKIAEAHLSLSIETDFRGLADFLSENGAYVYQCFNTKLWPLDGDCFWFRIFDMHGRTVASHADRIYETDDFCGLMESGELWYSNGRAALNGHEVKIKRPPVTISGKVGHSGSMWVHPQHRGKGLSLYLPYLSRSLCLRNFNTDYHTGFVFKGLYGTKVPRSFYGYPHVELCIDGYCPPTSRDDELYLCWISQQEAIDMLRTLPTHPEFPVALEEASDVEVGEVAIPGADYQHRHFPPVFSQRQ